MISLFPKAKRSRFEINEQRTKQLLALLDIKTKGY
jgi:hypothetical protein